MKYLFITAFFLLLISCSSPEKRFMNNLMDDGYLSTLNQSPVISNHLKIESALAKEQKPEGLSHGRSDLIELASDIIDYEIISTNRSINKYYTFSSHDSIFHYKHFPNEPYTYGIELIRKVDNKKEGYKEFHDHNSFMAVFMEEFEELSCKVRLIKPNMVTFYKLIFIKDVDENWRLALADEYH